MLLETIEEQALVIEKLERMRVESEDYKACTTLMKLLAEAKLRAEHWESRYGELRDALCSKSWAPRDNHERVVSLAKAMKAREAKVVARRE